MKPEFRLRNHILMVSLAAAYPMAAYSASAARVEFAAGNVVAIAPNGVQRVLGKGSVLESGETVRTGDASRAQLRFSDGALMSLQPQTEFRIDDFKYGAGEEKGFFSLIKGGFRTITGWVGKGNRSNYKVSTSVATIGIRGTEYTAAFTGGTDGNLNLSTGEGAIEVCNSGGCVIVASGESAVVTGTTPPKRTDVRPALPATKPTESAAVAVSTSENRSSSGGLSALGSFVSGPGYAVAVTGIANNCCAFSDETSSTTATFDAGTALKTFTTSANGTYTSSSVSTAVALDGVIGWGVWSTGTYSSGTPLLKDVHYVVGKATNPVDLGNLSGYVGTYSLIGYTNPTSTTGAVGSNVTGSLTANYNAGTTTVDVSLSFTMASNNYTITANSLSVSAGSSTFSGSGSTQSSGSVTVKGIFAGANATHAGVVFSADGSAENLGTISGAAAFKRTTLAVGM